MKINVSYLLSYDYNLFLISVSQLYNYVDKIVVSIDIEYKTWSGNTFNIPNLFFEEVKLFDKKNIVEFYFDNFYNPDLTLIEIETLQRNKVLAKLGTGGWNIQLDVDEYIYDFALVKKYLKKYKFLTFFPKLTPICIRGKLLTLYKKTSNGFLYIKNNENFPFITNLNSNSLIRNNNEIKNIFSNIEVIHQSWARSEDEILFKIKNWGHRDDFNTKKYFEFWKNLDNLNYKSIKNFHPIVSKTWDKLFFLESKDEYDFIKKYRINNKQKIYNLSIKDFYEIIFFKLNKFNIRIINKIKIVIKKKC